MSQIFYPFSSPSLSCLLAYSLNSSAVIPGLQFLCFEFNTIKLSLVLTGRIIDLEELARVLLHLLVAKAGFNLMMEEGGIKVGKKRGCEREENEEEREGNR